MHLVIGPSSTLLGRQVQQALDVPASVAELQLFPDGESCCRVSMPDAADAIVIVHGTHPPQDRHLQQLYQLVDVAVSRAASEVICVVPYLAYARQDRRETKRDPFSVKIVLQTLAALGMTKLITVDVHNPQVFESSRFHATNLSATEPMADWLRGQGLKSPVLISPDRGGAQRAASIGKRLGWPVYVCDKHKDHSGYTWYESVGRALTGCDAIVIDDLCSSGSTLVPLAAAILRSGARRILIGVTHFFADPKVVMERIGSNAELFSTNSIPSAVAKVDLAPLIAGYLRSSSAMQKQRVSA